MLKILFKIVSGFGLLFIGAYPLLIYSKNLEKENNPLLLLVAIPIIIFGIYLLFSASRSENFLLTKPVTYKPNDKQQADEELNGILEKNNGILNQWEKTINKRDKLKMLSISAAAEQQKEEE